MLVEDDHRRVEAGNLECGVEHAVEQLLELDRVAEVAQEPVALALPLCPLEGVREVAAEIVHAAAHVVDGTREPVVALRVGAAAHDEDHDQGGQPEKGNRPQ